MSTPVREGETIEGEDKDVDVQLLLFESFGGFGRGYLDEVTWTTKNWLGLQKQRISVVLHTAIAEQVVNELACGGGGRVHGAKCLAALAGVGLGGSRGVPVLVPVRASPVPSVVRVMLVKFFL
ncbi:hypothetical protein EMIHUDRAFT_224195 [Emiliania huxleyi CCMP1516]|uniref:Uncharacterized protein n=2 Tax=Emiliania huxleyi TaxID=2903 RepID=A0A0D3KSP7_EMIH1|nr:hypothetical protein EMIHUDRAFT_224195 [Emiliania huxleyi CCMP1516]EOD38782.1 hypothetical protein EMIHUDRAFT_224195 [Emiliania huxleyi CCMP1516]|eukprot:XP_005791211.1 hypothetical protein EMIHUDRAFT_224195 [Emiliania huxleyi CCMP1516]